jgi:hypothetical protein
MKQALQRLIAATAIVAAVAVCAASVASAGTFGAVQPVQTVPPGPDAVIGGGGGPPSGCSSAFIDRHSSATTGTYGIHGVVSWCWSGSSVWSPNFGLAPYASGWTSVTGFHSWATGASCGGGVAQTFQVDVQWTVPVVGYTTHSYALTKVSLCPNGIGIVE